MVLAILLSNVTLKTTPKNFIFNDQQSRFKLLGVKPSSVQKIIIKLEDL